MKWLMELKKRFYNNKKIKKQILFYCKDLTRKPKLGPPNKLFGEYIFKSKDFADNFFKLSENLSSEDKKKLLSNIIRTAIAYVYTDSACAVEFYSKEEESIIKKTSDYMSQIIECDGYYELDGYKLPENFFPTDIFYDRLSLDKINKKYFSNKDIIDAGACLGDSSLILSEYTSKNVYAFEPSTENYDLLLKTITLNNKTNIIPVKCGLGDKKSVNNLENYYHNNIGGWTLIPKEGLSLLSHEQIEITTLDDYTEKNNIEVGLIKADIEGFEQKLLQGAKKTIEKFKPILLICTYHNPDDFFKIKPLIESWDLNYKFQYAPAISTGHFIDETMIIAEPNMNVLTEQ